VCYVEPLAAGSGIPEIKCWLNGVNMPNLLTLKTLVCKAVGVVFSVAAGLPCGKEGPMIHSGAIFGAQMTRAGAGPLIGRYRKNEEARDLTAAGAAAGVAAAFGAPVGGVLFAVEEGASHMNPRILVRCFVAASAATLTVRFFLGPIDTKVPWGTLGTVVPVEFGRFASRSYAVWELGVFACMGVFGGLCGAAFNAVNLRLSHWRKNHIGATGHRRFLEVIVVTTTIATIRFFMPMVAGSSDIKDFNSAQKLFVGAGNEDIHRLFHDTEPYDIPVLLMFLAVQIATACWTYGIGVPSGLFVPSLLTGAAFGRIVGQVLPQLSGGPVLGHPGVYALIGATAFLSGMARITISLAVILMETTGEAEWSLPIFITVMAAKWTGDLFNKGLYDIHIDLKKVPLLEGHPEKSMLHLRASDVMAQGVVTLAPVVAVGQLTDVLDSCAHCGFPLVDPETQRFMGLVERSILQHVLSLGKEYGVFYGPHSETTEPAQILPQEAMYRQGFPSLVEFRQGLTPEDRAKRIDLRPYANSGCFTIPASARLARCYMLFRNMGLRHLPVLGTEQNLCGIITRKDLIFDEEEFASPAPYGQGAGRGLTSWSDGLASTSASSAASEAEGV